MKTVNTPSRTCPARLITLTFEQEAAFARIIGETTDIGAIAFRTDIASRDVLNALWSWGLVEKTGSNMGLITDRALELRAIMDDPGGDWYELRSMDTYEVAANGLTYLQALQGSERDAADPSVDPTFLCKMGSFPADF